MKKILSVFMLLAAASVLAVCAQAQVIVIANPSVKADVITKNDLRGVFTGNAITLKDGSQVVPILLRDGAAHEEFLLAYIGKDDAAYRAGWRSILFSGQGMMPKTLDSEAAVVEVVKHTAGAIGYIERTTPHEGVKVLAVR
jgi:ABC-type phosphate transport system substrate-binding protein